MESRFTLPGKGVLFPFSGAWAVTGGWFAHQSWDVPTETPCPSLQRKFTENDWGAEVCGFNAVTHNSVLTLQTQMGEWGLGRWKIWESRAGETGLQPRRAPPMACAAVWSRWLCENSERTGHLRSPDFQLTPYRVRLFHPPTP